MPLGLNYIQLLIIILSSVVLSFLLFDYKPYLSKLGKPINIKFIQFILLTLIIALIAISADLITFLVNYIFLIFVLWGIIFSFLVNRKYIYGSSLFFLIVTVIASTLNQTVVAEYSLVFCFLLLGLGVIKDVFYEKTFASN